MKWDAASCHLYAAVAVQSERAGLNLEAIPMGGLDSTPPSREFCHPPRKRHNLSIDVDQVQS